MSTQTPPLSFKMDWPNLMFRCNHCPYVCSFFSTDLGEVLPVLQRHHDGAHGHPPVPAAQPATIAAGDVRESIAASLRSCPLPTDIDHLSPDAVLFYANVVMEHVVPLLSRTPATVDDTALRERIKDVFERESLTPDTAYVEADRGVLLYELMAVVQPVLSAKEAEVERLRAELERERDPNVELSLANQAAFSAGLAAEQARYADGFKLERGAARAELAALRAQQVAMVRLPEDWRAQLREDLKVPRYVQAAEWCIEAWRSATEIAVGDRVEWNPQGDRWEPGVVTGVNRHHLVIVLDDNGQSLTVMRSHVRRPATEPAETTQAEMTGGPQWWWVTCCEAGQVAYPDPCPWHGTDGHPATPATERAEATAPRVFRKGDPEPSDINQVKDDGDRRWCRNRADRSWYLRDIAGPFLMWDELLDRTGLLTEVPPGGGDRDQG